MTLLFLSAPHTILSVPGKTSFPDQLIETVCLPAGMMIVPVLNPFWMHSFKSSPQNDDLSNTKSDVDP